MYKRIGIDLSWRDADLDQPFFAGFGSTQHHATTHDNLMPHGPISGTFMGCAGSLATS
jgi:hypothetical protein